MSEANPGLMTIVGEALEYASPVDRAAYLDRVCAGDVALRQRVEALLAAHAGAGRFLEPDRTGDQEPTPTDPTGAFDPGDRGTVDLPSDTSATGTFGQEAHRPKSMATRDLSPNGATDTSGDTPARREHSLGVASGTIIAGRYTLVEVIGEGGMGSVYLAIQTEPVKRQVALKLIKMGMDSKAVLARFDAERQALAMMDHPNIARIYDGGVTEKGQPFFVMELVDGVPLTEYCDAHRLTIDARLQLFVSVCQAVQHAHQKGIIHRDLKPGNVLVTEVDGQPTPKVIDFGVAKATELKLTDQSFSDTGAIVGTPAYMSPEQADPTAMDIDTRSDVYALGVMLYELLTGSPPIDARQFKRGAILEMLRMVREVEPPRPSTKLSTAEALPNVAANRSIEPTKLARLLRGELDWVVMKAIEKDRTRRYETANAFIRDIQRYLADEVVEARPPSRGYRLKKFVKRNRGQVLAASLVLLALVGGVVGTTIGLLQANAAAQKERDANGAAQAALTAAENAAKAEAAAKITAQNAAAAETVAKLDAQNAVVREKAANERTQRRLAQIEKGVEQLAGLLEGINPRNEELGGPPVYQQLRERAEQAADALDADAVGDPLAVARLQGIYGNTLRELGNAAKAVELLEKARATLERESGADQPDTLRTLNDLASAYQAAGRTTQAIELFEQVRDARVKILGPDHTHTLTTLNNLGLAYQAAGRTTQAIELFEQVREALVKKLGPDHPHTLTTRDQLAYQQDKLDSDG